MTPWTSQWGPRSFIGNSPFEGHQPPHELQNVRLFFVSLYLLLFPLWMPIGVEKEREQESEREGRDLQMGMREEEAGQSLGG